MRLRKDFIFLLLLVYILSCWSFPSVFAVLNVEIDEIWTDSTSYQYETDTIIINARVWNTGDEEWSIGQAGCIGWVYAPDNTKYIASTYDETSTIVSPGHHMSLQFTKKLMVNHLDGMMSR